MQKELTKAKAYFYTLCQQYEALTGFLLAEEQAVCARDVDRAKAARTRCYEQQFAIGEQLKILGASLDAMGGEPVLLPPGQTYKPEDAVNLKEGDTTLMQSVAKAVDDTLPDGFGFMVFAFTFDGIVNEPRLQYASNARREDAVNVVSEWLGHQQNKENWGKHTP